MPTETVAQTTKTRTLIQIRPTDRVFITGAAGSGKTRLLATELIPRYAHTPVILDPKGDFPTIKGIPRTKHYQRGKAQILHIPRKEQSPEVWDNIIDAILSRGNHTLVIDDLYAINGGNANPRPNLLWAISGGRSLHVPVWTGVQRPARLPISVLSESEHYFVFPLRHAEDRKRITENTSQTVGVWLPRLDEHDYCYYHAVPPRRVVVVKA